MFLHRVLVLVILIKYWRLPVRNHKLIIDVVLVLLRILLILIVGALERLAWFLLLPLVIGIDIVIEPLLRNNTYEYV